MNQTTTSCNRCGEPLRPGARFCNSCGAPQGSVQNVPPAPAYQPPPPPTYVVTPPPIGATSPPTPPKPGPNWMIVAVGGIAACLCGTCLAIGLFVGGSRLLTERGKTTTPTATRPTSTSTVTPTSSPTPTETPQNIAAAPPPPATPVGVPVTYEGISFSYDPSLARQVLMGIKQAVADPGAAPWEIAPQHYMFEFDGYTHPLETFHQPHIIVYPANEFAALSSNAAQIISRLKDLLNQKLPAPDSIPFLPPWNAAQLMRSNIRYMDFQNGRGVRFLSQYGQAAYPINNTDLFYSFQGLTHDGRYYISAVLPVSNPILPDPETIVLDEAFFNNFESYARDMEQKLNSQPDASFTPSLALLDALIQSFLINK